MADKSGIEWTDATWNPIVGCSLATPGCTHCYAMSMAARIERMNPASHYVGTTRIVKGRPVWTGKLALAPERILLQPLRWSRPRRIFVNSMGDLFHEKVPDEWIDQVFAVMALAHWHTFQVLTKRSARMRAYFAETWQRPARAAMKIADIEIPAQEAGIDDRWSVINKALDDVTQNPLFEHDRFWTKEGSLIGRPAWPRRPLPNVWLGVSTEDQQRADERAPDLLATPAAVRFVSAEPLLGPIDFHDWFIRAVNGFLPALDLIIVGGESGPGARPMHPDWVREIRDPCAAAGVAFFFKQHGDWIGVPDLRRLAGGPGPGFGIFDHCPYDQDSEAVRVGKRRAGRLLDGIEHNGMPERSVSISREVQS